MEPKLWQKILARGFIALMLLLTYLPILVLIIFSFTQVQAGQWTGFSFAAYKNIVDSPELLTAALNTFILAGSAAFIATVMGTFAAIGLVNMKRKAARAAVNGVNQIPVVNADIVTAISIMLLFVALRDMGAALQNEWLHLIIGHTVITTPFVVLAVMPRLRQLNQNVYEAALDLGATPFQATVKILIPQLVPAMITAFALAFTLSIDDFVVAQYNSESIQTISTYIYKMLTGKPTAKSQDAARAFSAILFTVVFGALMLINIKSMKAGRKAKREKA